MSGKVYKGSPYTLKLESETDLSSTSSLQIGYRKPSGIEGVFSASVTETTKLYHDLTGTENNEAGDWRFRSYPQYLPNGEFYKGETWIQKIWDDFE